ncbi:MAG: hypothetical protein JRH20_05045 [Deltaproteobacteria bacterium]|nr:hypothetical protein [Deltaproteobacteria bacterium]
MRTRHKLLLLCSILGLSRCSFDLDRQWTLPQTLEDICSPTADAHTLALFRFRGASSTLNNEVAQGVEGMLMGSEASRVGGPHEGCGGALKFPTQPTFETCESCTHPGGTTSCVTSYGVLPGGLGTTLRSGCIDFWVYLDDDFMDLQGILGRDAMEREEEGHLSVRIMSTGGIGVRLQNQVPLGAAQDEIPHICSPPISRQTWHHVGINFGVGGLELTVDGIPHATVDPIEGSSHTCHPSGSSERGLTGNDEPWILGATADSSCVDSVSPPRAPLHGRLANLRISSIRRDFSSLALSR